MGLSLFNSVMFEPRNDAIHDYAAVDLALVEKAVQLANLTVKNCVHGEPPGQAPIFYGTTDLCQGREAVEKQAARKSSMAVYLKNGDLDGLFLTSIGPKGEESVLIDRNGVESRVLLLTSDGDRSADVRFCPINQQFKTERLQQLFNLLEAKKPKVINVAPQHAHTVVNSLGNRSPQPRKGKA